MTDTAIGQTPTREKEDWEEERKDIRKCDVRKRTKKKEKRQNK